jgi:hypothetical protein
VTVPGDLADLLVGVALREQAQRPQLLRLQGLQRLAAAGDRFLALGPLRRPVLSRRNHRHPVLAPGLRRGRGGPAEDPLAVASHRQRLVLDDGLGPADQFPGILAGRLEEEDLERSLQGVVGVVGAERVAPGGATQRLLVLRIRLDGGTLARRIRHGRPHGIPVPVLN